MVYGNQRESPLNFLWLFIKAKKHFSATFNVLHYRNPYYMLTSKLIAAWVKFIKAWHLANL